MGFLHKKNLLLKFIVRILKLFIYLFKKVYFSKNNIFFIQFLNKICQILLLLLHSLFIFFYNKVFIYKNISTCEDLYFVQNYLFIDDGFFVCAFAYFYSDNDFNYFFKKLISIYNKLRVLLAFFFKYHSKLSLLNLNKKLNLFRRKLLKFLRVSFPFFGLQLHDYFLDYSYNCILIIAMSRFSYIFYLNKKIYYLFLFLFCFCLNFLSNNFFRDSLYYNIMFNFIHKFFFKFNVVLYKILYKYCLHFSLLDSSNRLSIIDAMHKSFLI